MIVGVCDTDPVIAGLVAHYLSVAFDVASRVDGIHVQVGVLEPFTLTDASQVGAIGESPTFRVIDGNTDVDAYVALTGFGSAQVEERIARGRALNVCLGNYLGDRRSDDPVALADACLSAARDLIERLPTN